MNLYLYQLTLINLYLYQLTLMNLYLYQFTLMNLYLYQLTLMNLYLIYFSYVLKYLNSVSGHLPLHTLNATDFSSSIFKVIVAKIYYLYYDTFLGFSWRHKNGWYYFLTAVRNIEIYV
jgi:hypothetical protein